VLHDIVDLGIPAVSKVVDMRGQNRNRQSQIPAEAADLIERLNRMAGAEDFFGDYTAVMTWIEASTRLSDGYYGDFQLMDIYAREGEKGCQYSYYDGSTVSGPPGKLRLADLPGWPRPDVKAVLASIRERPPTGALAWDDSWARVMSSEDDILDTVPKTSVTRTLPPWIWQGLHTSLDEGPVTAEVLRSADYPGLVGLYVDDTGAQTSASDPRRKGKMWWLDPSNGYLPVEMRKNGFNMDGKYWGEQVFRYRDFVQLPSGRWYPSCWERTIGPGDDPPTHHNVRTYWLQIRQDISLDDEWFDPAAMWPEWYKQKTTSPLPDGQHSR
jgi:hypothetical protein